MASLQKVCRGAFFKSLLHFCKVFMAFWKKKERKKHPAFKTCFIFARAIRKNSLIRDCKSHE
jgi:hypothetical protein